MYSPVYIIFQKAIFFPFPTRLRGIDKGFFSEGFGDLHSCTVPPQTSVVVGVNKFNPSLCKEAQIADI